MKKYLTVAWYRVVWFPAAIPKYSFVLWLAFHGALVSREKMVGWGYMGHSSCLLCRACIESQAHLFFSCSFGHRLWQTVMSDCSVHNPLTDWDELVLSSVAELGGKAGRRASENFILVLLYITCGYREILCSMVKLPRRREDSI
jgi:hypothetical protein